MKFYLGCTTPPGGELNPHPSQGRQPRAGAAPSQEGGLRAQLALSLGSAFSSADLSRSQGYNSATSSEEMAAEQAVSRSAGAGVVSAVSHCTEMAGTSITKHLVGITAPIFNPKLAQINTCVGSKLIKSSHSMLIDDMSKRRPDLSSETDLPPSTQR